LIRGSSNQSIGDSLVFKERTNLVAVVALVAAAAPVAAVQEVARVVGSVSHHLPVIII
jgi:hypothetical protein